MRCTEAARRRASRSGL